MTKLYFDVTDIVYFAARYSRVTGIQRVQLNIITLLARKYGGSKVRCVFSAAASRSMLEFDPSLLSQNDEFDAECFLSDLGRTPPSSRFPSKAQIKSYLRRYNNRKVLRTLKKVDIYFSAAFMPGRLARYGLTRKAKSPTATKVALSRLDALPEGSRYVCMGSVWKHPEVLAFCRAHRARGLDVVQMVYDLIPIVHPENYTPGETQDYAQWLNDAFNYVSRFICISQWTRLDLLKYAAARGAQPAAQAIPLAHEFLGFDRTSQVEPPPELSTLTAVSYALCVGTIETRKNCVALLKAWQRLASELGERMPLLVFAGKFGKGSDQFQRMLSSDATLSSYVRVTHAPSDRELAWLYQHSAFTVFPSTYEGWGLPVGESVWFGKYCVASAATSIPEVCGALLEYHDPADLEQLCAHLRAVITDSGTLLRKEAALAAAPLRHWSDVAEDIYSFVSS